MASAFDESKKNYKQQIKEILDSQTKIKLKDKLQTCNTLTQNETVM